MDIQHLIRNDPKYTVGALLNICPINKNIKDANILNDLSNFYIEKGFLTDKQVNLIKVKLEKYLDLIQGEIKPVENVNFSMKKLYAPRAKIKEAFKHDKYTIKVKFPYCTETIQTIKTFNGRAFIPDDKSWTIPLTVINYEKIIELGFKPDSSLVGWYNSMNTGVELLKVQDLDDVLRDFQKKAVGFIQAKNGRALIADDQGLGKTLEAIAWMHYNKNKDIYPILIVVPAAVKLNWRNEIDKFINRMDEVEIVYGRTPYPITERIAIINYDIIAHWEHYLISKYKPKTIIADEIHKCKSSNTKRSKSMLKISHTANNFIGMTGTPILNRPIEIYHPLKMIAPNLFPNKKAFATRYCDRKYNGFGWDDTGAKNTIELNHILTREVMLRRKKEDVLKELPDKTRSIIPLEIDNRAAYNHAYTDLINFLKQIDLAKAISASRAETLVKVGVLKQLTAKGKLKQSVEWISDFIEDEKLVVFVHHKKIANFLMEKFDGIAVRYTGGMSDKQREHAQTEFWKNENVKLFIGNIDAAGVGINLQIASNVAFVEYPWSPGLYRQAEDRVHRFGQKNAVNVWNLVADDTIENAIVNILDKKARIISEVIDGDQSSQAGIFNELLNVFYKKPITGRSLRRME